MFDETYLGALKDRKPYAEDHLVSYFSRPVQAKLRAQLRSPELVQDACQETFLRVLSYFRAGKTLDNPASLPGFVHRVSHNVALEFLRAHTRHQQVPEDFPEPADSRLNPEGERITAERKELVERLLGELSESDRQLLRRVFLNEEDRDLVCRDFHVDRDYLRVLLHRATVRFRAAMSRRNTRAAAVDG